MKRLGNAPSTRTDRPASHLLHDEGNVRVVAFALAAGQVVPPHSSPSTVMVHVLRGRGLFVGGSSQDTLEPGHSAVYEPGETHSIEAGGEGVEFLAIISPGPH